MNQKQMILQYMEMYGSITPMEAFMDLNCTKLATRISELIRDGHEIRKASEQTTNSFGKVVRYMRYSLGAE